MPHDEVIRDIYRRLNALERTRPRLRLGEVTDVGPLDVSLGGSDTSYEDVAALGGPDLATGDQVAALLAGNDLLVLGALAGLRIVRGTVSSAGAVARGDGFTAANTGTGAYTVTFDTAFSAAPSAVVTAEGASRLVAVGVSAAGSITVAASVASTGAASDVAFSFVAIGPA